MNTTGIPVWQNGSGSSADSYTENVENQIRKANGKLKKGYIERIDIIDNDKKVNKDKTEYKGKDNNN